MNAGWQAEESRREPENTMLIQPEQNVNPAPGTPGRVFCAQRFSTSAVILGFCSQEFGPCGILITRTVRSGTGIGDTRNAALSEPATKRHLGACLNAST